MREIPAEIKTLLKSRCMIGENKPNYSISINEIESIGICKGKVLMPLNPIYTHDLYMILPIEKLVYERVNDHINSTFDITQVESNKKVEFKIWVRDISTWKYQSNINHCHITQIDSNTAQLNFEDGGNSNFLDVIIQIYNEGGLTVSGQEIILGLVSTMSKIPVKSININRNKNMAGSLSLVIDNKNGKYSPDGTALRNVLFTNKQISVKQGYGANLITTFTGLIDRIEMTTFPQELKLSVRDKLKLALDQIITWTDGITHVIYFQNQTVESIFTILCGYAGLTAGTIESTGLTLAEKTFSWETYADCFSWLADLVGFEFGADEEGLVYFRKDTVSATPTVAYTFKEGEDIISLGYTIDDNDLYYKVIVYGNDSNGAVISASASFTSAAYYNVLSQKIMKIDANDADTVAKCQAIADRAISLMGSRVRTVSFAAIAVPWLQVGDVVEVIESSTTISEKYRITDLSTVQDSSGYTMQITCYHHSA